MKNTRLAYVSLIAVPLMLVVVTCTASSLFNSLKKSAGDAAAKAKVAASNVAAKAKVAAGNAAAKAKVAAAQARVMFERVSESLKLIPTRMKEKVQALSFESAELDLTVPIIIKGTPEQPAEDDKPAVPATPDRTITVGIRYPLDIGYGDPEAGFAVSTGVFYPNSIGPIPVSPAMLIEKIPGIGPMIKDVQNLKPQTVFLIKLTALLNDAKKMPPLDAVGFVMVNSNFLLARLSKTPGMEGKGLSALLDVLPGPLKDIINQLKLPVTEGDAQEFKDRHGKPPSEMQKNVSLVRFEIGFKRRVEIIEQDLLPLINRDLNESDKALFIYALQHQAFDLDQGFLPSDLANNQEMVKKFITKRANTYLPVLEQALEKVNDSRFTTSQMSEVQKLESIISQTAMNGEKAPMKRPELAQGGQAGQKIDVPLSQFFDIKWYQLNADILNRKFAVDGYFHEDAGPYLFDDSYLSMDEAIRAILAIFFRCIKEKNNPEFSVAGFMKEELGSIFNRIDDKYRNKINELAKPFMKILSKVKGLAGIQDAPVTEMLGDDAEDDLQATQDAGLDDDEWAGLGGDFELEPTDA